MIKVIASDMDGTLLNNNRVEVANQTGRDYRPPFDGVLEIRQGGQYDGGAELWIYTDKDVAYLTIALGHLKNVLREINTS